MERLSWPVDRLELSVRSYGLLKNARIATLGELVANTEDELLKVHYFGRKSLREIKDELGRLGLRLAQQDDDEADLGH